MTSGAKILVRVVRTLGVLVFMAGVIAVGYLALIIRFPVSDQQAEASGKIGPALTQPRPAILREAKQEPPARDVAQAQAPRAATPVPAVEKAEASADLETGSLAPVAAVSTESEPEPAAEAAPQWNERARASREGGRARTARYAPGSYGCERYRSFDAATGTYRGFDGRVHECRVRSASR